jgi:DNA-binding NarL/FixJ family response regulator
MLTPLKLYVIDDHQAVRAALVARLRSAPDVVVLGETAEVETARAEIASLNPDVVLLDTKRADGRGFELLNWLLHAAPACRAVVLTAYVSEWERWAVMRAGAAGYALKDIDTAQLLAQIRAAASAPRLAPTPPTSH